MTQEHREQFLATEGWQQTERGHIRGPELGQVVRAYANKMDRDAFAVLVSDTRVRLLRCGGWRTSHRRRFPFGRQPKHDALVGWFVTERQIRRGGLREMNEMADEARKAWDKDPKDRGLLVIEFHMAFNAGNKRQGWKTIELNGERVVVEVEG